MSARFSVSFDTTELDDFADSLRALDAQTLSEIRRDAVNIVSLMVRDRAIDRTTKDLNLSQAYVEARIDREESQRGGAARALVRSQVRGTTLQRFGAGPAQLYKPVNWSNQKISDMGGKFGPWANWTRRTGDSSRGIPVNEKQNGVAVAVRRGSSARRIATGFTMPLRAGKADGGNGMGVFVRGFGKGKSFRPDKKGAPTQRYGPSVYQVFRRYVSENETDISDSLRDEFIVRLDTAIKRIGT